jgi:hypothetical protein
MKRLLILFVVIMAVILIKRRHLDQHTGLSQEQTIEELKKEVKQLKKTLAETNELARK